MATTYHGHHLPWLCLPWLCLPWLCLPWQANAEALQLIDAALFVLCLDDDAPPTPAAVARTMLHGTYAMNGDGVQVGLTLALALTLTLTLTLALTLALALALTLTLTQVGSVTNRWYDKMQIIVCANGSAGVNFEHTSVDGHTVTRLVSNLTQTTRCSNLTQPTPNPNPQPQTPKPQTLLRCSVSSPTSSLRPSCASPPRSRISRG